MEAHLVKLLQKNEAPSDQTVSEIKEILREPSEALLSNDLELQRLDQAIQALRQEQDRIRDFVKPYNTVLAPIRRVPAKVLNEIFYHCIATHRYPVMDASEAPLLLTHICSSWRTIALSSPRIWSKLFISLPTPVRPPQHDTHRVSDITSGLIRKYERAAALRSETIKVWLDRSGDYPLSISVMCSSYASQGQDVLMRRMLDNILLFSRRWKAVELVVPYDIYSIIETSLSSASFPILGTFRLKIHESRVNLTGGAPQAQHHLQSSPLIFLKSSQLNALSLSWPRFTQNFYDVPSVWSQLNRLFLQSPFLNIHLIPLLSQCPNLVECRFHIIDADHDPVLETPQMVSLPGLQSFIVYDASVSLVTAAVFNAIQAPALSCIGYTRSHGGLIGDDVSGLTLKTQLSSISNLLKAASIDKLALALAYEPPKIIIDLLGISSHARHVILGHKPLPIFQADTTGGLRYRANNAQTRPKLNQFPLDSLTVRSSSLNSSDSSIMLPNLQILEVYNISNFSDEDALEMIKSRLLASKTGHVAALRMVKLHFDRQIERDIKEEIEHYARDAGASLKLELGYEKAEVRAKQLNPLYSAYGLTKDGLSWGGTVEYDQFQYQ